METLSQKQQRHAEYVAELVLFAVNAGYRVAFGEAARSNEQAEINAIGFEGRSRLAVLIHTYFPRLADCVVDNGKANGVRNSLHQLGLAVDLKLFKDGVYLSRSEDYKPLGEYWEGLAPDCRWGGRFLPSPDGDHFSIEHNGVK
jgi:hypothetical protein